MLASFTNGPLDGTEREIEIAFALIEIWWVDGMDPQTAPLFQVAIGAEEIWQYSLESTDYETRATYWGIKVNATVTDIEVEEMTWTAAGRHFDVYSGRSDGPVLVEVNDDEIYFTEFDITVRVAQRQGE